MSVKLDILSTLYAMMNRLVRKKMHRRILRLHSVRAVTLIRKQSKFQTIVSI